MGARGRGDGRCLCMCVWGGVNNNTTSVLSWPLLSFNSSAFLWPSHTDRRAHRHIQMSNRHVYFPAPPPHVNMHFSSITLRRQMASGWSEMSWRDDNARSFLLSSLFATHHMCMFIYYFTPHSTLLHTHTHTHLTPSPLTPCSGAQESHRMQCPWNTPPFPHLWAHCRRSKTRVRAIRAVSEDG